MRILFIGDIVGRAGRSIVIERLYVQTRQEEIEFAIVLYGIGRCPAADPQFRDGNG